MIPKWWSGLLVVPILAVSLPLVLRSVFDAIRDAGKTDPPAFADPVEQPWYGPYGVAEQATTRGIWVERSRLEAARRIIRGVLFSPSELVAPHLYYDRRRRFLDDTVILRSRVAELRLRPIELAVSRRMLILAAAMLASTLVSGRHWYLVVGTWWILIANIGRQVGTVVSGGNLLDRLRHGIGTPVRDFARLAVTDLLTLILAAVLLANWSTGTKIRAEAFTHQASEMAGFRKASDLLLLRHANAGERLVGVASLCFYALVLSQAKRPSAFKRTSSDKTGVALALLHSGGPSAAEQVLATCVKGDTAAAFSPGERIPVTDGDTAVALGGLL